MIKITDNEIKYFIDKNNIDVGNSVLYNLCDNNPLDSKEHLSAQIWLIGRAYAASPERRHYKLNGQDIKIKLNQSGDGLDTFFDNLSEELLSNEEYKKIIKFICDNKNKKYKFDKSKEDWELLQDVSKCVDSFNNILKDAIKNVDKVDLDKNYYDATINNFISFSSKFLHFHLKNIVFIKDSISAKHLSDMNIRVDSIEPESKDYYKHIIKEYVLGCELKQQNVNYINPRNIDTFVMSYKKEGNNE